MNKKSKKFDSALGEVNRKYGRSLKRLSSFEDAVEGSFQKFLKLYKNLGGKHSRKARQ